MNLKGEKPIDILLLLFLSVPVVGLFMGGLYSWPAIRITGGREPWLSLLLGLGLAITVFGLGLPADAPRVYLAATWFLSLGLLVVQGRMGSLSHNLERFGMVHALALILTFNVMMFAGGES